VLFFSFLAARCMPFFPYLLAIQIFSSFSLHTFFMMKCTVAISPKKDKSKVFYLLLVNNEDTPMPTRDLWRIL
jgi:hypothetical protein